MRYAGGMRYPGGGGLAAAELVKKAAEDGDRLGPLACMAKVRTIRLSLADLAEHDEQVRRWLLPLLAELTRTGTPAMRSRGRKLLARLEQPDLSRRSAGGTGGGMTRAGEDAVQ